MKILLIRHGDPDYEHDTLTEQGWREAELLAQRMKTIPVDGFYLSPLGRAQDTASVTLKALNRTGETLPWLREFRGCIEEPFTGQRRCPWNMMPQIATRLVSSESVREQTRIIAITADAICALIGVR